MKRWTDLSTWHASNLTIVNDDGAGPTADVKIKHLVEDSQNTWRNVQTSIEVTKGQPLKATAEIKGDAAGRHAVVMLFSGHTRIACDLDTRTGKAEPFQSDNANIGGCAASSLGNGWWHVELTGTLNSTAEPAFLTIAVTRDGFHEDYQGDGSSGIWVGEVTLEGSRQSAESARQPAPLSAS